MKAVHTLTVAARLPVALAPLQHLAMNLGWVVDERVQDLFRRIDPETWDYGGFDAVGFLARAPQDRLDALAADPAYTGLVEQVRDDLRRSLHAARWFQRRPESDLRTIAYFSPEFGLAEALPQYSGGLGILAGDHLKAAAALGVPLVGIGLFYHHGYFAQELDARGWQQERFPRQDPRAMALHPVPDVRVEVHLAGATVRAQLWRADVERIALYLLDTDVADNDEVGRLVTDRLYGGDAEQRIRQEIVLGIGGVRALDALGITPDVFHMNEGHAGFLALERIRRAILEDGLSFAEAIEATRPAQLFTTHTPVPAGIDRFPRDLVAKYLSGWVEQCGVTLDELMDLGWEPGTPRGEVLNLAVMGMRLSGRANGVSQLHGHVSRQMFAPLWPDISVDEVPIGAVTNGVHARTWVSREMDDLLERHIGGDWPEASPDRWEPILDVPDEELWALRRTNRDRLVAFARRRLRQCALRRGLTGAAAGFDDVLDPTALTLGFARRFASYKRATLLLRDPDRLRALLLDKDRPVQLIFAGKAHPADDVGKELLRQVASAASADPELRERLVFLEDYDIGVGRMLYRGCDVWLNTPRRPYEACGTSGMKAALNGALNCSTLDGWWDELYDPDFGWALVNAEWIDDEEQRDTVEANSLYTLLEEEIVPLFYDRADHGLPRHWIGRVKQMLARLGPQIEASRMLREYTERFYEPAAARSHGLRADGDRRVRELVAWKDRVLGAWDSVAILSLVHEDGPASPGTVQHVRARVQLGPLAPDDVEVQLCYGLVDLDDEIRDPIVVAMKPWGDPEGTVHTFRAPMPLDRPGAYGFHVRAVPAHVDLSSPADLTHVTWAPAIVTSED